MRPGLLFADPREGSGAAAAGTERPAGAERVAEDLGLSVVIEAMADGDAVLAEAARTVLLSVPPHPAQVAHRQGVLADCLREPQLGRELYELAGRALDAESRAARAVFFDTPETLLNRSIVTLTSFVPLLRELRAVAERYRQRVTSAGLRQFFATVEGRLDEAYLNSVTELLGHLKLGGNLVVSARLGTGNQSAAFVIQRPQRQARGLFRRSPGAKQPSATYKVAYGDEAGHRALSSLRDQALAGLADAAVRSAQHVSSFFSALRFESAFYVGCLHLHRALTDRGAPVVLPVVHDPGSRHFTARGLYDPGLQLRLDQPAVANDVDAGGTSLIMVTGANRGGKSTFLRSVGLAELMAAAGMFVAATAFTTSARSGVHTHFTQDEDATLTSGKLDEELRRMSRLADVMGPHSLLLCNESFQSTNEREGSDIARHIVDALTAAGATVVFVTHLHELAQHCYDERDRYPALFLRAEPEAGGHRSYRLHEAPPEATSHGADLWHRAHHP
ncbi:hypothetical protein [Actinoplanes sp. M2I2]|uniref:MutS-related protein n=1 Tax=Actinoplanes sp. M2I2 TaxID=1734444 RepID=UPI0020210A4C|nr:hypothetical protein [Actinoplanes sp. M2I2]